MPRGSTAAKAPAKPAVQSEEDDSITQAVVLTGIFEGRFYPVSAEKPKCLLPLANVPILDYTLEMLSK